jgi:hypothetical protein
MLPVTRRLEFRLIVGGFEQLDRDLLRLVANYQT